MARLDEIRAELAGIQEQLLALPDDAFGERSRLVERQHELRAEAEGLRDELPETRAALVDELERLRARYDEIMRQRLNVAAAGAGDEAQGGVASAQEVAFRMDEATGRRDLERRIVRLRARLAELSEQPADAPDDDHDGGAAPRTLGGPEPSGP